MTMVAANKHKTLLLTMIMTLFIVLAVFFAHVDKVFAVDGIRYLDQDGTECTADNCISVSEVRDVKYPALGGMDTQESRKAGTTCIYAYAQDGVCKRIRVTVN